MSNESLNAIASSSRASSMAGRKRPRESEGDVRARARRTKSTGDARSMKDREAFQRGLIAVFVPNALRESVQGNLTHYNDLLAHFLPTATTPIPALPPLLPLLRAITAHVSLLSAEIHSALITAIINLPWATGDERFVKTFVGWAGVLVSAQPSWAKEVVGMAVKGFRWQPVITSTGATPISRRIFHARHHLLLSHLLSLIPTLPSVLQPLLVRNFPNKREPEVAQTTWVRNSVELIGYCPELGQRVWGEIVDRMLRIDVEITNILDQDEEEEDDEEEDDDDEADDQIQRLSISQSLDPFDLLISEDIPVTLLPRGLANESDAGSDSDPDPDELSSVDGDGSESDEEARDEVKQAVERARRREAVKSMRGKLDGMLFYFFEHLEEYIGGKERGIPAAEMAATCLTATAASSGRSTPTSEVPTPISGVPMLASTRAAPSPAQALAHFQTLLTLFSRQILPTSSTQHIPFLLFLTASFSHAHTDLFLGLLVSQALYGTTSSNPHPSAAPISLHQRVAATVYIGSAVCRARFVSDDQARAVLAYLLAYVDGKLHQPARSIDERPLFYAVVQAVMLIFCFRWRGLRGQAGEGDNVLGELELESEGEGDGDGDGRWMRDLDILQRALTSELNPLLGCNPTVVSTFAKVAHQTNFAYCFSILESNARPATSTNPSSSAPRQARQANLDAGLDSYFPFDPYELPRSRRFVDPLYRTWGEVALHGQEDEDSDDDDDEGTQDDDDDSSVEANGNGIRSLPLPMPKVNGASSWGEHRRRILTKDGGLSSSMEGMSISPNTMGLLG
ncbi:RNA polymerase I-specific transcription initiation factor RRN3 [Naematelia encephala]|uniref:RNA polymerase I-specific transcription initiation factor RRN3 n=1 Tax=Naematelia encephala TaxID=71784 RepID=A0A1Y2ATM3_9TREE|nr:RNA polymerase I-specific transcription initiation factor RRN3 [Naematelia encephala]